MFFLEMLSKMASKKFLEGPSMLLTKCLESTNEKSPFFLFSAAFLLFIINNLINSFLFLSYIIIVSYLFGFFPHSVSVEKLLCVQNSNYCDQISFMCLHTGYMYYEKSGVDHVRTSI